MLTMVGATARRERYGYAGSAADCYNDIIDGWDDLPFIAERIANLLSFAEFMGYTIDTNAKAASGYSVTSPSGQRLSGFVANGIIKGFLSGKAPHVSVSAPKKGSSAKSPEQKAADKAAADEQKRATAVDTATKALARVLPDMLEARSKGKVSAATVDKLKAQCAQAVAQATDAKGVRDALQNFRDALSAYKAEMTKPLSGDAALRASISKVLGSLPNATVLAGTKYNPQGIQQVIDKGKTAILSATTPAAAQAALKDLRQQVALEKLAQAKAAAAQKVPAVKLPKVAASTAAAVKLPPKKHSEAERWAQYYSELYWGKSFVEPDDVHVNGFIPPEGKPVPAAPRRRKMRYRKVAVSPAEEVADASGIPITYRGVLGDRT
jgi:hypothetical protein